MVYNIQQNDIALLKQLNKQIYSKIELLNYQMKTVDVLDGVLIDDSYNIDAESDIRRTISLQMVVKGNLYTYTRTSSFWLDKYLRISVGYYSQREDTVYWYPLGIYILSESNFTFDGTSTTVSLSCVDLMAKLTGLRGGQLTGLQTKIAKDSNLRNAIISTIIQLGGFTKYRIEDPKMTVPYEIELDTGSSVYDLLCKLRDLKVSWEMFFDTDGTFVFQPIPQCIEDSAVLDDTDLSDMITSENLTRTDNEVKNVTIVYGKSLDTDRYSETVTNTNEVYNLTLDSFTTYTENEIIAFTPNIDNLASPKIKVNSLTAYPIVSTINGVDTVLAVGALIHGKPYVFQYKSSKFYYLGQFQVYGIAQDTNPSSPFYVNGTMGVVPQTLSGGDYEKIYTDQLATERAEYENWKSTRFNETVDLSVVTIPFLDVNQKINHTSLNTGEAMPLITKKITGSISKGTGTISCIHWYPLYPFST